MALVIVHWILYNNSRKLHFCGHSPNLTTRGEGLMAKNFVCTTTEPIVQTKAGKLRGFILDGTYTFYGIKYADAKRFQQPTPPPPGEGVKDALG